MVAIKLTQGAGFRDGPMELVSRGTVMRPIAGSHLDDCKREAVAIAAIEKVDVQFDHNGTIYVVRWEDLLSVVKAT